MLGREALEQAAVILDAPRLLMAWEDRDEPWLHLASWARDKFRVKPEPVATFQPLVANALAGTSFLCADVRAATPAVFHTSPVGVQRWEGMPLHAGLQARFDIAAVLAASLRGESLHGYLLALGKSCLTTADLILGEIVARHVAAHMDQLSLAQPRHQAAIAQERFQIARDLHDGLLHSLSSANFRLASLHHLPGGESPRLSERVREIQHLLTAAQGDLRSLIDELRPGPLRPAESAFDLAARLDELRERIHRHWGLRVALRQDQGLEELPEHLRHDIYFLIHEAMINAARHAQASTLQVDLRRHDAQLRLVVADNGRGFAFRGHHDLPTLTAMQLGPRTLKERLTSLGGTLVLDSTASGPVWT